jgi:hypothetical protein
MMRDYYWTPISDSDRLELSRRQEVQEVPESEMTIRVAIEDFMTSSSGRSEATKKSYRYSLSRFATFMESYGMDQLQDIKWNCLADYAKCLISPYGEEQKAQHISNGHPATHSTCLC